jgi:hypothetical protein
MTGIDLLLYSVGGEKKVVETTFSRQNAVEQCPILPAGRLARRVPNLQFARGLGVTEAETEGDTRAPAELLGIIEQKGHLTPLATWN